MTNERLIVGAGGFGRELRELLETRTDLRVRGFLDDDPAVAERTDLGAPYLGAVSGSTARGVPCVLGVGYQRPKRAILEALNGRNAPSWEERLEMDLKILARTGFGAAP